ncbi:hypothetical protein D3C71_1915740 [compost metagenome]
MEIHRAVLDLQNDIIMEGSDERLEMIVSRSGPVRLLIPPVLLAIVDEASPDDQAAVRLDDIRQHIGPIGMSPFIGEGSRASFGIGLNQESA